jgi:hypothetical protein
VPLTIDELYAWVISHPNGDEGIPAAMGASGMWLPLIGADQERMESFRGYATELAASEGRPLHLARFGAKEVMETIEPPEAPHSPQEAPEPEPATSEPEAAYQTFSEPLPIEGAIHADGVLVAGSMCEDGQFGLTIAFMINGKWSPAVMVKGKVADDLMSLAAQAKEAYKRSAN